MQSATGKKFNIGINTNQNQFNKYNELKFNIFGSMINNIEQNNINTVMTSKKINFGINTNQNNFNMASQLKQNTFEPIIKNIGQNNINTVMTGYKVNFGINTNQNNLNKASQFRLNTNQNNVNAFQNNSKSAQVLNNNLEITQSYTQIHQNNMDQVEQLHNYQIYLSQRLGWLTENVYLCKDIQNQQLYACKKIQFENVPNLVAPEVLYKSTYTCSYKADIYSLGVLLYQMTNDLYYPYIFKSQSDIDYFHQYSQKYGIENTLKFKSLTNERVKNLIYQMMQYYEDDRISIQELVIQTQQIAYNQQEILFNLW
ncbi:hypothetical protein ABPG74_009915 [Tetrahymena malaccensis]